MEFNPKAYESYVFNEGRHKNSQRGLGCELVDIRTLTVQVEITRRAQLGSLSLRHFIYIQPASTFTVHIKTKSKQNNKRLKTSRKLYKYEFPFL